MFPHWTRISISRLYGLQNGCRGGEVCSLFFLSKSGQHSLLLGIRPKAGQAIHILGYLFMIIAKNSLVQVKSALAYSIPCLLNSPIIIRYSFIRVFGCFSLAYWRLVSFSLYCDWIFLFTQYTLYA